MSSFEGYICWDAQSVNATIAPDVASAHDATLLATHQSLPLARCSPPLLEPGEQVAEEEVLQSFLESTNDPLLMAVVGASGSGKSHLIRWMNAQLQGDGRYRVIYVPRQSTNLRAVLRRILTGLPGEEPRELLEELETATSSLVPEQAAAVLFDQLCNVVEFQPPSAASISDQGLRSELSGLALNGERQPGLADVLRLPQYRKHLLADDGVISSYVRQTFGERQGAEPRTAFSSQDLRLGLHVNLSEWLQPAAHQIYAQVMSNDAWASEAAKLLNDSLEDALGQVLGLQGGVPLADVMNASRVLLAKQDLELVLLIEDFALLQNKIDRQLLDALLIPTTGAADEELRCPIRTAFAITDHPYLELPETLRTRLGLLYWTNIPFDDAGGNAAAGRFVAAYLNAARVGAAGLDEAFDAAATSERTSRAWIPNQCDGCEHRPVCHDEADGFGSIEGYGLYPYNRPALERVLGSVLREGRFDPRTLVSRVVGEVLSRDAEAIENLVFPSTAFGRRYPPSDLQRSLPAEVKDAIGAFIDAERRALFLEFWGAVPDEPVNLGDHIHEAFGLSRLDEAARAPGSDEHEEEGRPQSNRPRATPPPVEGLDAELSAIDDWLAQPDRGLGQELANRLRRRLHDLVLGRVAWNDELLSTGLDAVGPQGEVFATASFQIDGASRVNPKDTAIRFSLGRTPEDALILKAVLQFDHYRHWEFRNGARQYLKLAGRLDTYVDEVLAGVRRYGAAPDSASPVGPALETLILSAQVLGVLGASGPDPLDVVLAALAAVAEAPVPVGASPNWLALHRAASGAERESTRTFLLGFVQAAQGEGGGILAVDLAQLLPVAEAFCRTLTLSGVPRHAPLELRQFRTRLHGSLDQAIDQESARVATLASEVAELGDVQPAALASALLDAGRVAADHGLLPEYGQFGVMCEALSSLDTVDLMAMPAAAAALSGERAARVDAIVKLQPVAAMAAELLRLLAAAHRSLDGAIQRAESELQQAPDIDAAANAAIDLLNEIETKLGRLGGNP